MDFRVEECESLPVGCEGITVAVPPALDQPVGAESGQVVTHLIGAVVTIHQRVHEVAKAPVGEPEDVEADTQCAEQGHDPRVSETHGWSPFSRPR